MSSAVDNCRVVVVGAGHAGGSFVLALRRLGFTGKVTLIGDEDETPYERPALSKGMLQVENGEPLFLADAERWSGLCDLTLATVVQLVQRDERRLLCADGAVVPYDVLVLATGPRRAGRISRPARMSLSCVRRPMRARSGAASVGLAPRSSSAAA